MLKNFFGFIERPGNHMYADQLADATGRNRTCFRGSLHRADISTDQDCDVTVEEIFFADENDVGGLAHGVCGLDGSDKAARFNHSQGIVQHGWRVTRRVTYQKDCTKAIDSDKTLSI